MKHAPGTVNHFLDAEIAAAFGDEVVKHAFNLQAKEAICRKDGHDYTDLSHAGPDSATDHRICHNCGDEFYHVWY